MAFLFQDPRSPKFWQAGWIDANGKRRNRSTKVLAKHKFRREAQSVADAYEDASRKLRTAHQTRKVIAELHRELVGEEMGSVSLRRLTGEFTELKRGETGDNTMKAYVKAMEDLIKGLGEKADNDAATITQGDMITFRNKLSERVAEATVGNKFKAYRALFKYGLQQGYILDDPTSGLRFQRKAATRGSRAKRAFTIQEIKRLLAVCDDEWRSMILLGIYTGQRLGDLATITWSEIDLQKEQIRFYTNKGGKQIHIPCAASLIENLRSMYDGQSGDAPLHPTLSEIYEATGSGHLSNRFAGVLYKAGLRDKLSHQAKKSGRDGQRETQELGFHCLRATAVTLMHEAGIPPSVVESFIGHDSAEVHKVYIKLGEETMRNAAASLPKFG